MKGAGRQCKYEVSVVVLSYRPDYAKLRQTILSAVYQEDVNLEIIVADDGSPENCRERLEKLFADLGFEHYKLVMNPENHGTIANFISGMKAAEGEYTKAISPGDFLSGKRILREWLDDLKRAQKQWSFSEALFYRAENGREVPVRAPAFPVYLKPYENKDDQKARWNYVVLDDAAHGSTMIGKTALLTAYAKELADAGNKYGEDYLFRLLMFDGICGHYFPKGTVFYEFGSGVSSGKNKKWTAILFGEYLQMNRIMAERTGQDPFQKKMSKYSKRKTSAFAMVFVPGKMQRLFRVSFMPRRYDYPFEASEAWRQQCR